MEDTTQGMFKFARAILLRLGELHADDVDGQAGMMLAMLISAHDRGDSKEKTLQRFSELWDILSPTIASVLEIVDGD